MKRLRPGIALLLCLMLLGSLFACTPETPEQTEPQLQLPPPIQEESVDLVICAPKELLTAIQSSIPLFFAQYPEVTFNIRTVPLLLTQDPLKQIENYGTNAPDVVVFDSNYLQALTDQNYLSPATPQGLTAGAIAAAQIDGTAYGYPLEVTDCSLLYYDSRVFSPEDVTSLEEMCRIAREQGKTIAFVNNEETVFPQGFFQAAGLTLTANETGDGNVCNWDQGPEVYQKLYELLQDGVVQYLAEYWIIADDRDGNLCAVLGNGIEPHVEYNWGGWLSYAPLPTFQIGDTTYHIGSDIRCTLAGVPAESRNVDWAHKFAQWLTGGGSQIGFAMSDQTFAPTHPSIMDNSVVWNMMPSRNQAMLLQSMHAAPDRSVFYAHYGATIGMVDELVWPSDLTPEELEAMLSEYVTYINTNRLEP